MVGKEFHPLMKEHVHELIGWCVAEGLDPHKVTVIQAIDFIDPIVNRLKLHSFEREETGFYDGPKIARQPHAPSDVPEKPERD